MNWLCWHVGTVTDPKFQSIAKRCGIAPITVVGMWAYLLERAAQAEERGKFGKIDPEDCAICTGMSEETIGLLLTAFDAKGLTSDGKIVNWKKRQHGAPAVRMAELRATREQERTSANLCEQLEPVPPLDAVCEKFPTDRQTDKDSKTQSLLRSQSTDRTMNGDSRNAARDSGAGGLAGKKKALWEQGCINWIRLHWSDQRADAAIAAYLLGNPSGQQEFERANAERRAAIEAGQRRAADVGPSRKH